jgi:hypothetical protein
MRELIYAEPTRSTGWLTPPVSLIPFGVATAARARTATRERHGYSTKTTAE